MSNSPLVDYTKISPHSARKTHKIDKITIHHMAGNLSVEVCGNVFSGDRVASANYGVGTDGRVGLYVEEKDRAFTSSNVANDNRAITIEVANDTRGPDWHVSDTALAKTIELCVDICKRNGIKKINFTGDPSGNLTMHKWFYPTACPGPYLESKFPYIANEINKRLGISPSDLERDKYILKNNKRKMLYNYTAGKDVKYLQESLQQLGYNVGTIDSQFGRDTENAVRKFQRDYSLEADGVVGPSTWTEINGAIFDLNHASEKPSTPPIEPEIKPNVKPEENNTIEYIIQKGDTLFGIARKLGISYNTILKYNDIKNPSLIYPGQKLIIPGKENNSKPSTPSPLPEMPDKIEDERNSFSISIPKVSYGQQGQSVKNLQSVLVANGYSCGPSGADGMFGGGTLSALNNFQRKQGLPSSRSCDQKTWEKLLKEEKL